MVKDGYWPRMEGWPGVVGDDRGWLGMGMDGQGWPRVAREAAGDGRNY